MIFLRHFNDYCDNTVHIVHQPTITVLKMFIFNLAKYSGCAIFDMNYTEFTCLSKVLQRKHG